MTLRFGVIPTNGRPCVDDAVAHLLPQVSEIAVIEAGQRIEHREYPEGVTTILDPERPDLNISRWWNLGIDWAAKRAAEQGAEQWDVAVINDDVMVPTDWLCYIANDLRGLGCLAGCTGGRSGIPVIHRQAGPIDLFTRIQGFAYVLVGESGLRADEDMKWWYQDDDLGARAAAGGGMVMFPGCNVEHLYPNCQTTAEQHYQIAQDRNTFIAKRGYAPW